jgi:WD40-like Beta Propeller Repeat
MRKRFVVLSLAAGAWLAVGLIAGAGPALATYPGANGRLAFGLDTGDGNVDVYSVRPNGNDLRRLTTGPSFDACAAYSPDGTSIAYCGGVVTGPGQGPVQIWAMQANGKHQHQITHFDAPRCSPTTHPTAPRSPSPAGPPSPPPPASTWSTPTAAGSPGSPPTPATTCSRPGRPTGRRSPSSATAPACSRSG